MTRQETINRLKSDYPYAVDFIISNNPSGVISKLKGLGFNVMNAAEAKALLLSPVASERVVVEVFSIPYINDAPNFTGGLNDSQAVFRDGGVTAFSEGFSWASLGGAILAGVNSFLGINTSAKPADNAAVNILLEKEKIDNEKNAANTRNLIIGVGIVLVVAAILIAVFMKKNKTKS